ncbi:hypothetical protein GLAREA_10382 [Glarea lozoyensis ATCC 20868]|uniref:Heterokaryon incompatibility domain-containing protein n=1 Tax=Glarea lozoyensis (strain ATCC 20868 / MF5171) TaxID=1116229 RepID=S3E8R4_GLAL2|nr:uncharacterized protein GLAREA_10382 [Glarea lozoyensis ATCC 20868]EPE34688.1 hypothetical protein GLAREA_10382 [Glarea lozoyensis ATCC 20868]
MASKNFLDGLKTGGNATKSNLTIDGFMAEAETSNVTRHYEDAVQSKENLASDNRQNTINNVMDLLRQSMAATQATTEAALAQGEADRQHSKMLALLAKDQALEDFSGTWKLQPTSIRLIHLQPSTTYESDLKGRLIQHDGFDANQFTIRSLQYAALSYTWGAPIFNRILHCLDGNKIEITENLDLALRKVRDLTSERVLWVDAVCINQKDLAERTFQVKTMHSIYYQADEVHAWLGPESELNDGNICFSLLEAIFDRLVNHDKEHHSSERKDSICHRGQSTFTMIEDGFKPILSQFDKVHMSHVFEKFFERKYFSRRWIIQEITFAQNLTLHCGNSTLEWTLDTRCSRLLFLNIMRQFVDERVVKLLEATLLCKGQNMVHMQNPVDVMLNADRFGCLDDRDRVIALLHVLRLLRVVKEKKFDHILKRIGYFSSLEEVYLIFAQFSMLYGALQIKENKFTNLHGDCISHLLQVACSTRPAVRNEDPHLLPSWVPDWRQSVRYAIPRSIRGPLVASNISCGLPDSLDHIVWGCSKSKYQALDGFSSDEFLHASGMLFDTIKETRIFSEAEILGGSYSIHAQDLYLRLPMQESLGHSNGELYKHYYNPTCEEFQKSLATTLIADHEHCDHTLAPHQKEKCDTRSDTESFKGSSTTATPGPSSKEESTTSAYHKRLMQTMRGRCFFTTSKGYIGIGPDDTQTDDVVCIFGGLRVPFIVRPQSTSVLNECCQRVWAPETNDVAGCEAVMVGVSADVRLVGDAYIHGIMDGDVVAKEWKSYPGAFQSFYIV